MKPAVRAYKPKDRWQGSQHGVVRAWKLAVHVGGVLLAFWIVREEVARVLALPFSPDNLLFLLLFTAQILLIVIWFWATQSELLLLSEWLDPVGYEPPSGQSQMIQSLGFALFLVVMLVSTRDPVWYGVVFVLYSISLVAAVRYFNGELRKAIHGSHEHLIALRGVMSSEVATVYQDALRVISDYFLKKPHTLRHIVVLAAGAIGLGLAIASKAFGKDNLRLVAYLIFLVNLVVSEIVMWRWRDVRHSSLDQLSTRLSHLRAHQSA